MSSASMSSPSPSAPSHCVLRRTNPGGSSSSRGKRGKASETASGYAQSVAQVDKEIYKLKSLKMNTLSTDQQWPTSCSVRHLTELLWPAITLKICCLIYNIVHQHDPAQHPTVLSNLPHPFRLLPTFIPITKSMQHHSQCWVH